MSDRDIFAAAALTGFLASLDSSCPRHAIIRMAYEYADAMLQERANHSEKPNSSTDHDAVPEAKAMQSRDCSGVLSGTGDTLTLTDEEREAVAGAADLLIGSKPGDTLRKLLERTK